MVQKLTSLQVSLLVIFLKCDMEWNRIGIKWSGVENIDVECLTHTAIHTHYKALHSNPQ